MHKKALKLIETEKHSKGSAKRKKFIALNTFLKKLERSYTSILTEHLKALEQKEAITPKRHRGQEMISGQKSTN